MSEAAYDHLCGGREALDGNGDAGEQSGGADGHDDGVELSAHLLDELEQNGAHAGHDVRLIVAALHVHLNCNMRAEIRGHLRLVTLKLSR